MYDFFRKFMQKVLKKVQKYDQIFKSKNKKSKVCIM